VNVSQHQLAGKQAASARPARVLHILNGAAGGAALSTIALVEAMAAEGIQSSALCDELGTIAERQRLADAVGGRVRFMRLYWWNRKLSVPLWRRPLTELRQGLATRWARGSAKRVARYAVETGAELIHTNTLLTPEGGLVARRLGLPHVWHLRELVGPGKTVRFTLAGPALGRFLSAHCTKLIANSHTAAATVRDCLPPGLLEVVPNGIDLSGFMFRDHKDDSAELIVGMVGNLTSHSKKHDLFVEAAAHVDPTLPIRWRIYGHDPSHGGHAGIDPYVDRLHAQIQRKGLCARFDLPGFVPDPRKIMAEIDLLVHPSDKESFGRVAVEAMAAGLPVVGTRGGGIAEIVVPEQTGLLAKPDDPIELAAAIERLARDAELRRRLGRAGRQRAEANYSLEACVRGVLAVYEQAMTSRCSDGTSPTADPVIATGPHRDKPGKIVNPRI
jgi:glycosyltransferase involved in cell wall biosynthesis